MKKLFVAFIAVLLPTFVVAAEQFGHGKKPEKTNTLRPAKGNHCAQYGAGFVPVGNTTTCIKIGGGVPSRAAAGARPSSSIAGREVISEPVPS
jgi:hypothetical protein